jgi:hypothetical protein
VHAVYGHHDVIVAGQVADPAALDELRKMHVMTTPVTKIGDVVIVGFDEEKLRTELAISG